MFDNEKLELLNSRLYNTHIGKLISTDIRVLTRIAIGKFDIICGRIYENDTKLSNRNGIHSAAITKLYLAGYIGSNKRRIELSAEGDRIVTNLAKQKRDTGAFAGPPTQWWVIWLRKKNIVELISRTSAGHQPDNYNLNMHHKNNNPRWQFIDFLVTRK